MITLAYFTDNLMEMLGAGDAGVTPALRRRRERAERQRSFIREQQEATATMRTPVGNLEEHEGIRSFYI